MKRSKMISGKWILTRLYLFILVGMLFWAGGCALMDTQTGDNKDIWTKVDITLHKGGTVNVYPQTQVEKTEGDTTQEVDGEQKPTNKIDATIPLTLGLEKLKEGGSVIMEKLKGGIIGGGEDIVEPAPIPPILPVIPDNDGIMGSDAYDKYNKGTVSIYLGKMIFKQCTGEAAYRSCFLNGESMDKHPTQDEGRWFWKYKGNIPVGEVVCSTGTEIRRFQVKTNSTGSCRR